ncbi:winged helix-turn-helix domain-containing protein [uncultured Methanobrevibacter sp.]|uniref:helix-turn-helix transcriptional regulator n=1 Tax=uncultured Methanobrevibacter sp. TaxID=253161 RepID=UPI0025D95CCE|nr:transcriptional regulator FilR1 domain-containing protein [uncultured Methanobrevibacter sp.]
MKNNRNKDYKNNFTSKYVRKSEKVFNVISKASADYKFLILKSLNEHNASLKVLHIDTGLNYPSLNYNIKYLRNNGLIYKIGSDYAISNLGKILFLNLLQLKEAIDVTENYEYFLINHNINHIPKESLVHISSLKEASIYELPRTDIFALEKMVSDIMDKSSYLHFIISEINKIYINSISSMLQRHIPVTLIIPEELRYKFMNSMDGEILQNAFNEKIFRLITTSDKIEFNLFLTDFVMGLNLFFENGNLDKNNVLISKDENSRLWAKSIFEECFDSADSKFGANTVIF